MNTEDKILFVVQIASLTATVVAVVAAWVTIRQAKVQAKESSDALLLERRIDFQTSVLREMVDLNIRNASVFAAAATFKACAAMLPAELVPRSRSVFGLESPIQQDNRGWEYYRNTIEIELLQAIDELLQKRV